MKKRKDTLYRKKKDCVDPFRFNRQVAESFDDMAHRSIPCYDDLQGMISRIAFHYYREGTLLYDLGCSTGNTALAIYEYFESKGREGPAIIAVDKSADMIEMARKKCPGPGITWTCDGIENVSVSNASVIVASFVLQFIPVEQRGVILKDLHGGLNDGGMLVLCEKVKSDSKEIDEITISLYYDYKTKRGYSDLEIKQKEKALTGVLETAKPSWYFNNLADVGFKNIEIFFKYLNFLCLIAVK